MKENLKHCPFCGSDKVSVRFDSKKRDGKYQDCCYVRCKPCGARGPINFEDDEELAITRWNEMKVN